MGNEYKTGFSITNPTVQKNPDVHCISSSDLGSNVQRDPFRGFQNEFTRMRRIYVDFYQDEVLQEAWSVQQGTKTENNRAARSHFALLALIFASKYIHINRIKH